jgi:hypothetical protein
VRGEATRRDEVFSKWALSGLRSQNNTIVVLLGNDSGGFTPAKGSPFKVGKAPLSITTGM